MAAAGLSIPAYGQTAKQPIVPKGTEWATDGLHFSPALRSGDLIYVSGVGAGLRTNETEGDKNTSPDDKKDNGGFGQGSNDGH